MPVLDHDRVSAHADKCGNKTPYEHHSALSKKRATSHPFIPGGVYPGSVCRGAYHTHHCGEYKGHRRQESITAKSIELHCARLARRRERLHDSVISARERQCLDRDEGKSADYRTELNHISLDHRDISADEHICPESADCYQLAPCGIDSKYI